MLWKKKKDNKLPDLPPAPNFPSPFAAQHPSQFGNESEETGEIHELPSFPDSPMQRGFSQAAIKEAVTQQENYEEDRLPALPPREQIEENFEQWESRPRPSFELKHQRAENKPIFVKLEKFQLARNSLENISSKLDEIDNMLKEIRQLKLKEDQELASWEADLANVKSRIQNILTEIFERTEY